MKLERKHLIAGLIGLVTITGATLYLQYRKLMNYVITVKGIAVKSSSPTSLIFDLILNFENKSSIKFEIISQKYDIYFNNNFLATLKGNDKVLVEPKGTSPISLKVNLNPTQAANKLKGDALSILSNLVNAKLKMDIKLQVKLYGFTINIPYIYETSLADMRKTDKK
jgi:LEA14-like dessication related protein